MLAAARQRPDRRWAIEGCQGIGGHIAARLLADADQTLAQVSEGSLQVCPSEKNVIGLTHAASRSLADT
jgi:hypothetical protein